MEVNIELLNFIYVSLDKLEYEYKEEVKGHSPHTFIYYLSIINHSRDTVKIVGRKWVMSYENGSRVVVEGEKVVGKTPVLRPGGRFSYNSFHYAPMSGVVMGSFLGMDDKGRVLVIPIPVFEMAIPER